jgi:hypothetical protein
MHKGQIPLRHSALLIKQSLTVDRSDAHGSRRKNKIHFQRVTVPNQVKAVA